jgi:hypothetical protein
VGPIIVGSVLAFLGIRLEPGSSRLNDLARSLVEATRGRAVPVFVSLCIAMWVLMNGALVRQWIAGNGLYVYEDANMTNLGLLIRRATSPETSIAVTWAGSIPYFADRKTIDLLGKCDAVIAHMAPRPRWPFVPGHNKWDVQYSVGVHHPDIVVQLPPTNPEEQRFLVAASYRDIGNGIRVREGSEGIDRDALRGGWKVVTQVDLMDMWEGAGRCGRRRGSKGRSVSGSSALRTGWGCDAIERSRDLISRPPLE